MHSLPRTEAIVRRAVLGLAACWLVLARGWRAKTTRPNTTTPPTPSTSTTATTTSTAAKTVEDGARTAAAVVHAHGYTANRLDEYHPHQALQVLVGTLTGTADGFRQKAFFFVHDRYAG